MRNLVSVPSRCLAALAFLPLCAGPAGAQPVAETEELSSPADFSGNETLIDFEQFPVNSRVKTIQGMQLRVDGSAGPMIWLNGMPRQFGPQGELSIINTSGYLAPFPDLTLAWATPIHRLAFEMRADIADPVTITLYQARVMFDQFTIASRGPSQFFFYGVENMDGFDSVIVDVHANTSGAFVLDNLRFEAVEAEPPVVEPPVVEPPVVEPPVVEPAVCRLSLLGSGGGDCRGLAGAEGRESHPVVGPPVVP